MCAVLGAVGTGEEEERGLPGAVVVLPSLPRLVSSTPNSPPLKKNTGNSHCIPVFCRFGGLGGENPANPQIKLLAGGHQRRNRKTWKGQGETELPCLTAVLKGRRKIQGLHVELRHYSGTNVNFLLVPMGK